jgi:hypothetical protein
MPRVAVMTGWLGAVAFGAAVLAGPAAAQSTDEQLIAKAKAEKEIVYYTELIVDQIVRPLAAAFERKYGIKVAYWRGDSQAAGLRLAMEHKAGRTQADVWSTASGIGALLAADLIERFQYPDQYQRGRPGRLAAARLGLGHPAFHRGHPRGAASQGGAAVRGFHGLAGRPGDFPQGRLPAGAPRRAAALARDLPQLAGFAFNVLAPEVLERNLAHWSDVYTEIFR